MVRESTNGAEIQYFAVTILINTKIKTHNFKSTLKTIVVKSKNKDCEEIIEIYLLERHGRNISSYLEKVLEDEKCRRLTGEEEKTGSSYRGKPGEPQELLIHISYA